MASNGNGNGGRRVGFHKGHLDSPFQLEYYGDEGMDIEPGTQRQSGPMIGPGALARRVSMELGRRRRATQNGGESDVE